MCIAVYGQPIWPQLQYVIHRLLKGVQRLPRQPVNEIKVAGVDTVLTQPFGHLPGLFKGLNTMDRLLPFCAGILYAQRRTIAADFPEGPGALAPAAPRRYVCGTFRFSA